MTHAYIIVKIEISSEFEGNNLGKITHLDKIATKLESVISSALELPEDTNYGTQILHAGQNIKLSSDLILLDKLDEFTDDWK